MLSSTSLHSSSTLLASSTNNSICEVTDLDTDCPSDGGLDPTDAVLDPSDSIQDSLEPPQVSISSNDSPPDNPSSPSSPVFQVETEGRDFDKALAKTEPDSSSVSIYESPMSSIYETPVSSPNCYATPMEGTSPWASPRTSIKSGSSISPINSPSNGLTNNVNNGPPQRGETVTQNKPFTGYVD